MKIAFTSCMSPNSYKSQPVWNTIAKQEPDVLVLLGDSVYIDCPPHPDESGHQHPQDAGYADHAFATHLHALYQKQLAVPEFSNLITQPHLRTYAIWDDHDFLWNDANGKNARTKLHMNQAVLSGNLLQCWRAALNKEAFPASVSDAAVQQNYVTPPNLGAYDSLMPGYDHIKLSDQLHLHLTDGRSWRTKTQLLGSAQRQKIESEIHNAPHAVHLVASGSTFQRHGRSGWLDCQDDHDWLLHLASQYRILLLSGDIHRNATPEPITTATGKKFYEVTASGAAVNFSPFHWSDNDPGNSWLNYSQKFGVLNVSDDAIGISLFDHGRETPSPHAPISIKNW